MICTAFELINTHNAVIHGDIRMQQQGKSPIILILHGFRGSKNWGFFPYMAETLAEHGAITITWNMSLNGYSAQSLFIDKPEDFARNTISEELLDTQCIIDALYDSTSSLYSMLSPYWNNKIYLIGHSRGAGIAILTAEKNSSIEKICLWNPISRFGRFSERQKHTWKENGIFQVDETAEGMPIMMNYTYMEDLEFHGEQYSLIRSIRTLNARTFIIHAEQDMTVNLKEAKKLEAESEIVQLQTIPATGHIFGCTHPFTEPTIALQSAVEHTLSFFDL